ncbi:SDR family oxidoreductase [Alkalihalobacillus sp. CinArs1]|uniref:SDR family oxidoreductase n=1 Tax=Alkalihalobacillus sp. CinArs1 TaxID=2995314 RepID=UPI0022DD815D|nr:SDR family oxidoreductase [Alkalihalobacillus sp. CinArs1]
MKVLVIGANGQVGTHVIKSLAEKGYDPVGMVRDTDQVKAIEDAGGKTVLGDLEKDFSHAMYGCEAVIFAAGSGPHTGADKTILIDQEGAIKSIDEASRQGIKRFVLLSSVGADYPEQGPDNMKPYLYAKKRADEYLKATNLTYTILRPGRLSNDPATGQIRAAKTLEDKSGQIPREDVASVLAEIVENENTFNRTFEILDGDLTISDALGQL